MPLRLARWLLQNAIALDQLACTLCGGWADETFSSYLHRLEQENKPAARILRPVIDWIAHLWPFRQADHCLKAHQRQRLRAQLPPERRAATPRGLPPSSS